MKIQENPFDKILQQAHDIRKSLNCATLDEAIEKLKSRNKD